MHYDPVDPDLTVLHSCRISLFACWVQCRIESWLCSLSTTDKAGRRRSLLNNTVYFRRALQSIKCYLEGSSFARPCPYYCEHFHVNGNSQRGYRRLDNELSINAPGFFSIWGPEVKGNCYPAVHPETCFKWHNSMNNELWCTIKVHHHICRSIGSMRNICIC